MSSINLRKTASPKQDKRRDISITKSPTAQNKSRILLLSPQPITQSHLRSKSSHQTSRSNHAKTKFDSQMQQMQSQIKAHKSKLCSCMEIYTMLESSHQNQRCLQHNNNLSLYCLNERRILCVNCLYGIHRHRSHKVVPLKDCMEEVYSDNAKLKSIIQQQIKKMDYFSKISQQNAILIQAQMRKVISEMQNEYLRKQDQIKIRFQSAKQLLIDSFTPIIQKCKKVKSAYDDFRFHIWKAFTLYSDQKATDENQIMKQMLFVTIVDLCQFRNRTISKTELQSLSRRIKQHF